MTDVEDIIDYIRSLKRGFDKDLFQSKIEQLGHVADVTGLHYDDFHTLFKIWLNLSIPITKWTSLGCCLVPQDKIVGHTVEYALRWLLANVHNNSSLPRVAFLLDWLTAAINCEYIDTEALDWGYEIFYNMLSCATLTSSAIKLVYTLTKPDDVTRNRVLELMQYAKNSENKKNLHSQLQALLSLFKAYKPECVPENVPAVSIQTLFKKINPTLLARFRRNQDNENCLSDAGHLLLWVNSINSEQGKKKKIQPLLPIMKFDNVGSQQYDKEPQKNYLDFTDPVSLLRYSTQCASRRPQQLRALLCNDLGLTLLALTTPSDFTFLSHDLYHLLNNCFLELSPYSYTEKEQFLRRLAALQRTVQRGLPVITHFLSQYLPFWNERDYFEEILNLVEWIDMENEERIANIVETLVKIYTRASPMEQCAILRSLTNMYTNMVYTSKVNPNNTMDMESSGSFSHILPAVASAISDTYENGLQISPEDVRVLYSGIGAAQRMCAAELRYEVSGGAGATVRPLLLAASLLGHSAASLDKMVELILLYKKVFSVMKSKGRAPDRELMSTLKGYCADIMHCLFTEEAISGRVQGFVFKQLHPQVAKKLCDVIPDANASYSIGNHTAFSPYTYLNILEQDYSEVNDKLWFDLAVDQEFVALSTFLKKNMPELR